MCSEKVHVFWHQTIIICIIIIIWMETSKIIMRTRRRRTFLCFEDDEKKFEKLKRKGKKTSNTWFNIETMRTPCRSQWSSKKPYMSATCGLRDEKRKRAKKEESLKCQIHVCECKCTIRIERSFSQKQK